MDQRAIFKSIADSFNKTPQEAKSNLIKIMLILILFSLIPLLNLLLRRRKRNQLWSYEYESRIRKLDLTINEIDVVKELSLHLVNPRRTILLLNNRSTFNNALLLWEKKHGKRSEYLDSLLEKLFNETIQSLHEEFEKPFGVGKPVRLITPEGQAYSGLLAKQNNDLIILDKVQPLEHVALTTPGQLFVQDSKGIRSHSVLNVKRISPDSLQLNMASPGSSPKKKIIIDIILYNSDEEAPVKTRLQILNEAMGIIENSHGNLVAGQIVKIALRRGTDKIYHVNGTVKALSLNKRYAKVAFGHVKRAKPNNKKPV